MIILTRWGLGHYATLSHYYLTASVPPSWRRWQESQAERATPGTAFQCSVGQSSVLLQAATPFYKCQLRFVSFYKSFWMLVSLCNCPFFEKSFTFVAKMELGKYIPGTLYNLSFSGGLTLIWERCWFLNLFRFLITATLQGFEIPQRKSPPADFFSGWCK